MNRKGIILAAGRGTRLLPMTLGVNKHLLPVYDKPMIYYPLSLFLHAGIREILLILDPSDVPIFKNILGDGSRFGVKLTYDVQIEKKGIADAFIIAEKYLNGAPSCLILGDNLMHGNHFEKILNDSNSEAIHGATIFGYEVSDPERFGIVTFDEHGKAISIEEKPKNPTSSYAVPGIYFYDGRAPTLAKSMKPSARGELEITDLNKLYLEEGTLMVKKVPKEVHWFDAGTHDSLIEASSYVQKQQKETGKPIANLESIAHSYGYINNDELKASVGLLSKSSYGEHIKKILENIASKE